MEAENRALVEQIEDLAAEKDEGARVGEKRVMDMQMELEAAQRSVRELEQERDTRESVLQTAQAQVAEKDAQVGTLESEVLRLKAHTGDAETMAVSQARAVGAGAAYSEARGREPRAAR